MSAAVLWTPPARPEFQQRTGLHFNPLDAGRRYTGFAQTSKWRQTPVYRVCANFPTSPEPGIPGLRKLINRARHRYTGFIF